MDTKLKGSFYTLSEEIGNAVTHGAGALLAIFGTVLLLIQSVGSPVKMTASAIYGASATVTPESANLPAALYLGKPAEV